MTTAALNTAYLSTYTGFPEPTIQTLIDAPTPELVASFLHQIILKAQDHDRLKAERLRLTVELENAVRSSEAKVRAVKVAQEKAVKDVDTLQERLREKGRFRTRSIGKEALTKPQKMLALPSRLNSRSYGRPRPLPQLKFMLFTIKWTALSNQIGIR